MFRLSRTMLITAGSMLFLAVLFLSGPAPAQQVMDSCVLQPYTRCPGVCLQGANLAGINLQGAYLKNADLRNANLTNARLIHAYLYGARMEGAALTNADLSRAIWTDGRVCAFGSMGVCR
ncbi:pentapeptide repeat-containing protein [Desulfonatronovibrio hydrogenovorans]|uniref:pentapeptide repeat-containing protein n=1 Tax=Desulfonatronovibrio hydrogenovorans TaxID=53245 RepID=UPI00048E60EB|nr:pentapeptide repeat-containing protein [Desulfonatronovibrio hydrogenovorans]